MAMFPHLKVFTTKCLHFLSHHPQGKPEPQNGHNVTLLTNDLYLTCLVHDLVIPDDLDADLLASAGDVTRSYDV